MAWLKALAIAVVLVALVSLAASSYIVARDATKVSLKAGNYKGKQIAVVSYTEKGKRWNVLFWGAINARPYSSSTKQVAFQNDRSGGWSKFRDAKAWSKVPSSCKADSRVKSSIPNAIAACTMPNGEHWAIQVIQRMVPNMGAKPRTAIQRAQEFHISHWTDPYLPVLWMKMGWGVYGAAKSVYDSMYGKLTCNGWNVYGASATSSGNPLDTYGRNIYVDVRSPEWKSSGAFTMAGNWHRFNSFLAHKPNGAFCASVFPKMFGITRPGFDRIQRYRAYVQGPGVTPIVKWEGPPPGYYTPGGFSAKGFASLPALPSTQARGPMTEAAARLLNQERRALVGPEDSCYKVWGPV
jgi:hypothetical protein